MLPQLRGGDRNRTGVRGFAGPCLNHSATPPGWSSPGSPGFGQSNLRPKGGEVLAPHQVAAYPRPMDAPDRCPECGSDELRTTTRKGDIQVVVCGVCDWSSDPRVGRPPADRSKNFTLRRLLAASKQPNEQENRS